MQVILLEYINHLGQMGDVVKVKPGYGRNFLLPRGKALRATPDNLKVFENRRKELEAENLTKKKDAEAVAGKLEDFSCILLRQAGEAGQLYGSVSAKDIAEAVAADGVHVTRHQIVLDKPIKLLGLHEVRISLHPEVTVKISVNVARSAEEAERQVDDWNQAVAEATAEPFFESEELAKKAAAELSDAPAEETDEDAEASGESPESAEASETQDSENA